MLFAERPSEARQVFELYADGLRSLHFHGYTAAGGEALDAMIAFHEGDLPSSRRRLETVLRKNRDARMPSRRLVHFYLAAIAFKDGDEDRARAHLAATVAGGGDLFIAKFGSDTQAELFPNSPALPRIRAHRRNSGARRALIHLRRNLGVGLRILLFRKSAFARMSFTHEQTILLAMTNLIFVALLRLVDYSPGAIFIESGAMGLAAPILFFLVTSYLSARMVGSRNGALALAGGFYSALPALLVLGCAARALSANRLPTAAHAIELFAGAWSVGVLLFLVRHLAPQASVRRSVAAGGIFVATWLLPMQLATHLPFWIPALSSYDGIERENDDFLFAQVQKVTATEMALQPERAGIQDLYFVGFAGWDKQDVFLREASFAQRLFDRRFDTSGRSLLLANDLSARETLPAATKMNLRHVLKSVGARMNREEDVLVLFLTSHGSIDGLAIRSQRTPELTEGEVLTPGQLRFLLDEASIKWRVVLISGCYTGVFVDPLKNDFTLIATAAAADRTSFGCANGQDFTDFGRAVLDEQLAHERSFVTAFSKAMDRISQREQTQGLKPSRPQLFTGSAIVEKLHRLEERLEVENF